jgi:hypothetical protein
MVCPKCAQGVGVEKKVKPQPRRELNYMTVKEFCAKYGVDYPTVYNATWLVRTQPGMISHREFDEEDLLYAVRTQAQKRADKLTRDLRKVNEILKRVGR